MTTIPPNATIACTIISKNYLAAARTLVNSILQYHDDVYPVVLLVDTIDGHFDPAGENFHTMLAADLDIPRWPHFAMKYDIMELNTAVKPYLMEVLFDHFEAKNVIYFDPDIVIYNRLDELLSLLDQHTVVLTPHLLDPLEDGFAPSEITILQAGAYNLGFTAFSRSGSWREILQWWQRRLYLYCTREIERGVFVDQKWADLMPSLYEGIYVLRNPGYNIAYWNFKTRDLQKGGDGYTVNGHPLIFFHYSGFSFDNMEIVSKHQDRFTLSRLNEAYNTIFADYRDRLQQNGYETTRKLPYAYNKFEDGVPIPDMLRICLRAHDLEGHRWPDPFDIRSEGNFRAWATELSDSSLLSPYLLTFRNAAKFLRDAFPTLTEVEEMAYATWFTHNEGTDVMFHSFYVAPVKAALEKLGDRADVQAVVRSIEQHGHVGTDMVVTSRPGGGRFSQTMRYYKQFPTSIKPYLPPTAWERPPIIYTGPGGAYGWFRKQLQQAGVLQQIRQVVGLRVIMSTRFFLQYAQLVSSAPPVYAALPANAAPLTNTSLIPKTVASSEDAKPVVREPGVNVVGFIRSETGIGQIARNLMHSLDMADFPVAALPIETYDPSRKTDRASDKYPQGTPYPINVFQVNADMTFAVRDLLDPAVYQGRYNIGYWAWELDHFPDEWQSCFDTYNEIWVFSSFVQKAIAKSSPLPVVLMPVSFEITPPAETNRAKLGLPEDAFIALFAFDAGSVIERKNPWATVKAFAEAFSPEERQEKARLVMKVNNLATIPDEAARLREALHEVNGILIEDYLSRQDTYALLNTADVYISLHRSEGYGLTLAEAMAMGRPVIGTGYSGNTDFMNVNTSYMIPYELVTLTQDYHPYKAGNVWAEPDIYAAAKALREVYEHPEIAAEKGRAAAEYMRRYHNPTTVGEATANRIRYILKRLNEQ